MGENVLITGGAGFIGSHLADRLVEHDHRVRVLDLLDPQVHSDRQRPSYLNPECELIVGDVRNPDIVDKALRGVDVVVHLAAVVGVGQSMYEIGRYVSTNSLGTAVLLERLIHVKHSIKKLIVASSMSVYGEGTYVCPACEAIREVASRARADLDRGRWDPICPSCGNILQPRPVSEDKRPTPTSVYAITKQDQEQLALAFGKAYNVPTVALRYFNVYGPRQSLSNPYTGVVAIFAARLLNRKPPVIFEDGEQLRDFVHVSDLINAHLLAIEDETLEYGCFNVGTGTPTSVRQVAETLATNLEVDVDPLISHEYREGDIRHCYADITRISDRLGYRPSVSFREGAFGLLDWLQGQQPQDVLEAATTALRSRGLIRAAQELVDP